METKTVKATVIDQSEPNSKMFRYPCVAFEIISDDPNADLSVILKDMRDKGPIFFRGFWKPI
jgi:hypothetical protein